MGNPIPLLVELRRCDLPILHGCGNRAQLGGSVRHLLEKIGNCFGVRGASTFEALAHGLAEPPGNVSMMKSFCCVIWGRLPQPLKTAPHGFLNTIVLHWQERRRDGR
jgi:hypothetical protein